MLVSIIIPVYNEEKYITGCMESIMRQLFSHEQMEVFFVDGRSTDNTCKILESYAQKFPFIRLLDNPHRFAPHALNIGIKQSKGDIIMRMDAHCTYPSNYVLRLTEQLFELDADNVGGVWNTLPANHSVEAQSVAIASSHRFCIGSIGYRIGVNKIMEVDSVPFGCYRRDVFDKIGLFDEELIRNQDNEFNSRLKNSGGKNYLIPDVVINYYARDSILKICKMYYQYALFTPLVQKKLGKFDSWRRMIPSIFLFGLVLGGILSSVPNAARKIFITVYFAVIAIYVLTALTIGLQQSLKYKRSGLLFYLPITFFCIHFSYGWGYFVGLWKVLTRKTFGASVTR